MHSLKSSGQGVSGSSIITIGLFVGSIDGVTVGAADTGAFDGLNDTGVSVGLEDIGLQDVGPSVRSVGCCEGFGVKAMTGFAVGRGLGAEV